MIGSMTRRCTEVKVEKWVEWNRVMSFVSLKADAERIRTRRMTEKLKEKNVKWKVIQTPKICIIKAMRNPVSLTDEEQQQQNKVDCDVLHCWSRWFRYCKLILDRNSHFQLHLNVLLFNQLLSFSATFHRRANFRFAFIFDFFHSSNSFRIKHTMSVTFITGVAGCGKLTNRCKLKSLEMQASAIHLRRSQMFNSSITLSDVPETYGNFCLTMD